MLTWTGSLAEDGPAAQTELVDAAAQFAATGQGLSELAQAFRGAWVWVEVSEQDGAAAVDTVELHGLPWLPVRTTTPADEAGVWMGMTGSEVIELLLPQLPRGTGITIDPGAEHAAILPPIAEVLPADLVISPDELHGAMS
ncbi:hypothetical protein [Saccharopolyspora sp. NPDC002376]